MYFEIVGLSRCGTIAPLVLQAPSVAIAIVGVRDRTVVKRTGATRNRDVHRLPSRRPEIDAQSNKRRKLSALVATSNDNHSATLQLKRKECEIESSIPADAMRIAFKFDTPRRSVPRADVAKRTQTRKTNANRHIFYGAPSTQSWLAKTVRGRGHVRQD